MSTKHPRPPPQRRQRAAEVGIAGPPASAPDADAVIEHPDRAPASFASVETGSALSAAGGLFAVAPDRLALHEAGHFMGIDIARVPMLSIGTATVGDQPVEGSDAEADGRLRLKTFV